MKPIYYVFTLKCLYSMVVLNLLESYAILLKMNTSLLETLGISYIDCIDHWNFRLLQ